MVNYYFQSFADAWTFKKECEARGEFADFPHIIRGTKDGALATRVSVFESEKEQHERWRAEAKVEAAREYLRALEGKV